MRKDVEVFLQYLDRPVSGVEHRIQKEVYFKTIVGFEQV